MKEKTENRVVWGFLVVGFLSLIGGILIFIFIVPDRKAPEEVPHDVVLLFVQAFSKQNLLFNERHRYSPALNEVDIDQDTCRLYSCLLHIAPDGQEYELRLSRDSRTWFIHSKSPVPQELK